MHSSPQGGHLQPDFGALLPLPPPGMRHYSAHYSMYALGCPLHHRSHSHTSFCSCSCCLHVCRAQLQVRGMGCVKTKICHEPCNDLFSELHTPIVRQMIFLQTRHNNVCQVGQSPVQDLIRRGQAIMKVLIEDDHTQPALHATRVSDHQTIQQISDHQYASDHCWPPQSMQSSEHISRASLWSRAICLQCCCHDPGLSISR